MKNKRDKKQKEIKKEVIYKPQEVMYVVYKLVPTDGCLYLPILYNFK